MSQQPVDPSAAGAHPPGPSAGAESGARPDAGDPAARHPPSRSADPGQGSAGGFRDQGDPSGRAQPLPKGRDDDALAVALRERLDWFGDLDLSGVEIRVDDGRVTLSGEVSDPDTRRRLEARVAEVLGVRSVDNRLQPRGH